MDDEKKARNIGIKGIALPKEVCKDIKCPFHGKLSIRGRLFEGKVISVKPTKTAVVEWQRRLYIPKYERFESRLSRVNAYAPTCLKIKVGDLVMISECRPISKTKRFVVIENKGAAQ